MAYNDIIDIIANQYNDELNNPDRMWLFKSITAHEGPLSTKTLTIMVRSTTC